MLNFEKMKKEKKYLSCPELLHWSVSALHMVLKKQGAYPADRWWSHEDWAEMEKAERICP